jgi:iron complex outermembrane receptor protein
MSKIKLFRTSLLLAALSGGTLQPAMAQEGVAGIGDTGTRPAGSRLDRVEIISKQGSDNELRRRAKVAKQVYGREEIDQYGDTNVADVLKRLPGVSMQGNTPRMRGLGSGYTLLLVNGDPAPPGFALDQLDPAQVERIEITKGPTADQSAQAVAGAINVILKEAPKVAQRDLRLGLGYNADRPTLSGTFTLGEKWDGIALSLPVSVFEWRGIGQSMTERQQSGIDGLPSHSSQTSDNFYYGHGFNIGPRLGWRINDDQSLNWQSFLHYGQWNSRNTVANQVLSGSPSLDDNSDSLGSWQSARSNLQWVNHFSAVERLELKAGLQTSRGTFETQTLRLGNPQRHTVGDTGETGLTQAGNYSRLLDEVHSLTAGWDLEWRQRDEKREVTELGVPQLVDFEGQPFSARIVRQALYVQDEWEITKQWSTYLGLRGERIVTTSQGLTAPMSNTSSVLTPMWHLNYKLDPAGRDMVRASITRSYKAAGLGQLVARPALSALFADTSLPNTELSPDRMGNANLLPELATGLDMAYEKYLPNGGLISLGFFYRDVKNLVRTVSTLQSVSWATVARWVSQPVNFSHARTGGLELEIKGRAGELLPMLWDPRTPLNLRTSLNFYRSSVDALPGPNNRLVSQQPWSGNVGFDYRFATLPLNTGATLGFTPGYTTQQSETLSVEQSRSRSIDLFAQWTFSRTLSARISANNLLPLDTQSQTLAADGFSNTLSRGRSSFNASLEIKL